MREYRDVVGGASTLSLPLTSSIYIPADKISRAQHCRAHLHQQLRRSQRLDTRPDKPLYRPSQGRWAMRSRTWGMPHLPLATQPHLPLATLPHTACTHRWAMLSREQQQHTVLRRQHMGLHLPTLLRSLPPRGRRYAQTVAGHRGTTRTTAQ